MRKKLIPVVAVLLACASGAWAYMRARSVEPLKLSGSIESRDVGVGSLVGGRVASVDVEEGDRVTKGQTLVTLETDMLDDQIGEQAGSVTQAAAQLQALVRGPRPETVARARADWQEAERERARLGHLLEQAVISQEQYDQQATAAETRLQTLRELEHGSRSEDIAAARGALGRESNRLAYLRQQRKESVVVAPADGTIQSFDLRPGDLVAPNQPVAEMLEASQQWVRVYVPETRLGQVHLGQDAWVAVDTYPGRRFGGRVVEVNSIAEYTPRNVETLEQRNDQVFGVRVDVQPDPALKAGMAVTVTLPVR